MHAPPPLPTTAPPAASLPEAQPSLWQRLRRLTPYFSGQRWAWGLALFATLLGAATEPLMPALLTVEDYLARVLTLGHSPRRVETVPLDAALGRVLAVDVAAAVSVPPFDNSAMDGYAVRAADLAVVP